MKFDDTAQPIPDSNSKLLKRASASSTIKKSNQYITNQRHQSFAAVSNDFLTQRSSIAFSAPLVIDTMNKCFQSVQIMEEEIMLPSRLKDMSMKELIFDTSVQPDNSHEIYAFVRDMRDQLRSIHPFAENNEKVNSKVRKRKYSNNDEGIILSNNESSQFSSALSTTLSDEFEQSSIFGTSYDTIRDELKYHYYGLFRSLNNLTSMGNRVTKKYREECIM